MTRASTLALFALAACSGIRMRTPPPTESVCEKGGMRPAEQSMDDYGSTYTEGMNGPDPSDVPGRLVPNTPDAGCWRQP